MSYDAAIDNVSVPDGVSRPASCVNSAGDDDDDDDDDDVSRRCRRRWGGITVTFPVKLYNLLVEVDQSDVFGDIIHWNADGSAVVIQREQEFTDILLPLTFEPKSWVPSKNSSEITDL